MEHSIKHNSQAPHVKCFALEMAVDQHLGRHQLPRSCKNSKNYERRGLAWVRQYRKLKESFKKGHAVKNPALEKSGLEPVAPNRLADREHCALSTTEKIMSTQFFPLFARVSSNLLCEIFYSVLLLSCSIGQLKHMRSANDWTNSQHRKVRARHWSAQLLAAMNTPYGCFYIRHNITCLLYSQN